MATRVDVAKWIIYCVSYSVELWFDDGWSIVTYCLWSVTQARCWCVILLIVLSIILWKPWERWLLTSETSTGMFVSFYICECIRFEYIYLSIASHTKSVMIEIISDIREGYDNETDNFAEDRSRMTLDDDVASIRSRLSRSSIHMAENINEDEDDADKEIQSMEADLKSLAIMKCMLEINQQVSYDFKNMCMCAYKLLLLICASLFLVYSKWTTHHRCLLYWGILSYLASNVPSQYYVKWGCTVLVSLVSRIWQVMWWILFFISMLLTFSCLFYSACRYREPRPVFILLSEWSWWVENQVPHGKPVICPHIMYKLKKLGLILS